MEKTVYAYAKLNLSLDVVCKREDGYHDMLMVMQSVGLCDDIHISCVKGKEGISLSTNRPYLPCDDRNIAAKAAALFMKKAEITDYGVDMGIKKRIPVCAGLGGGSSDAAAVLRGLNVMLGAGFNQKELEEMAEELGSDVPYCIAGGTVLAEGRGERLTALPPMAKCLVVICKPKFSVSTPELFSKIKCDKIKCRPDTAGIMEALEKGSLSGVSRRMFNVFESVLTRGRGEIENIKGALYDCGALGAVMSGTGPAVFGIFQDGQGAREAFNKLKKQYRDCFLTETTKALTMDL